jgi:uncharacterized protein (DUF1015 family)
MATILPFRGVRYNLELTPDLSPVVTQPYDRIGPELWEAYHRQHRHNFVHLILNRALSGDKGTVNPYTRAASLYRQWREESVLIQDGVPAWYVQRQTWQSPEGRLVTRTALLAALELTPFDEGIVLPHERTLQAPIADRLQLLQATGVHLEPVFLLYPDPGNQVNRMLESAIDGRPPDVTARELHERDVLQQQWVVGDPALIAAVQAALQPRRGLVIADGHHRYQTALAYRQAMREVHPYAPRPALHDFVLAALVSMDDPGLRILPTHRLVHSCPALSVTELLARAGDSFEVCPMSDRAGLLAPTGSGLAALPAAGQGRHAIGFASPQQQSLWVLKDVGVMDELAPQHLPAWRELDVSILHRLVLEKMLGLTPESIARQENLRYLRDPQAGYRALDEGQAQCLFLLNPTPLAQVRACAEAGERMPQKSTDFYPKMISGMVVLEGLDAG